MNTVPISKRTLFLIGGLICFIVILQLDAQLNEEEFNYQVAEISHTEQLQLRDLNTQLALKRSNLPHLLTSDLSVTTEAPFKSVSLHQADKSDFKFLSNTRLQTLRGDDLDGSGAQHWPMIPPLINSNSVAYPISSPFGYRLDPIHHLPTMHQGVDFLAPIGTPIVATADGVIVKAGHTDNYGLMLEIQHANGFTSKYAHTSLIQVKLGDQVTQGQLIAYVGNSGRSSGAHLHYEVIISNKPIDPIQLLR